MTYVPGLYSNFDDDVRKEISRRKSEHSTYSRANVHDWNVQKLSYVKVISKGKNIKTGGSQTKDSGAKEMILTPPPPGGFATQYTGNLLKPNGILTGVEITTGGTAGALQKCTVKFTVFTSKQLEDHEEFFLFPGRDIEIEYGWGNRTEPANKGKFTGLTYNFNWNISSDGTFECTFQAVGPGYFALGMNIDGEMSGASKKNDSLDLSMTGLYVKLDTLAKTKLSDGVKYSDGFFVADIGYQAEIDFNSESTPGGSPTPVYYITFNKLIEIINTSWFKSDNIKKGDKTTGGFVDTKISVDNCFGYYDKNIKSSNILQIIFPGDTGNYNGQGKWVKPSGVEDKSFKNNEIINKYLQKFKSNRPPFDFSTNGSIDIKVDDKALLANTLISLEFIRQLTVVENIDPNDNKVKSVRYNTLHDLLLGIMNGIRDNSGGAYPLDIYLNDTTLDIICTNYIAEQNFDLISFAIDRNNNILRNFSIGSQLPNDMAVALYVGSRSNATSQNQAALSLFEGPDEAKKAEEVRKKSSGEAFSSLRDIGAILLPTGPLTDEKIAMMQTALHEYVRNSETDSKWHKSPIYPITLSITLDGISGIRYGNVFSFLTLPKRYIDNVVFMVTEINHSFQGFDWTTEIKAQCRFKLKGQNSKSV